MKNLQHTKAFVSVAWPFASATIATGFVLSNHPALATLAVLSAIGAALSWAFASEP